MRARHRSEARGMPQEMPSQFEVSGQVRGALDYGNEG